MVKSTSVIEELLSVNGGRGTKTVRDVSLPVDEGTVTRTFADGNDLGVFTSDSIDGTYSKGWNNLIPNVGNLYTDLVARIKRNKA
jgi:hypothetical protein